MREKSIMVLRDLWAWMPTNQRWTMLMQKLRKDLQQLAWNKRKICEWYWLGNCGRVGCTTGFARGNDDANGAAEYYAGPRDVKDAPYYHTFNNVLDTNASVMEHNIQQMMKDLQPFTRKVRRLLHRSTQKRKLLSKKTLIKRLKLQCLLFKSRTLQRWCEGCIKRWCWASWYCIMSSNSYCEYWYRAGWISRY